VTWPDVYHPLRVHDGAETPSSISLKQASTIAEMRTQDIGFATKPQIALPMEAPGIRHAATNWALVSTLYVRLVRRTAYLGLFESLSIVSTFHLRGHHLATSGLT